MDQAIVTAVELAHRYLTARRYLSTLWYRNRHQILLYRLPDSAFDLMDEACASARVQQDLKPETIEELEQGMVQQAHYIRSLEVLCLFSCPTGASLDVRVIFFL